MCDGSMVMVAVDVDMWAVAVMDMPAVPPFGLAAPSCCVVSIAGGFQVDVLMRCQFAEEIGVEAIGHMAIGIQITMADHDGGTKAYQ